MRVAFLLRVEPVLEIVRHFRNGLDRVGRAIVCAMILVRTAALWRRSSVAKRRLGGGLAPGASLDLEAGDDSFELRAFALDLILRKRRIDLLEL